MQTQNFPMNVFDSEAFLADQRTANLLWLLAGRGFTLQEIRDNAQCHRFSMGTAVRMED